MGWIGTYHAYPPGSNTSTEAIIFATNLSGLFDGEAARHPEEEIDRIINRLGGVGYCFGGKYIPRFLAKDKGIDAGFVAHPSYLTESIVRGVINPLSIASGTLNEAFNATAKVRAENILDSNNMALRSNLYFGAPHGFAVSVDLSNPVEAYAKQASFVQAVTWFDTCTLMP
ncbi:hypothetical protein BJY01DRAFT_264460 [Aspergillus pseudoustus]|uniref:Dienelactone hydrolase domain-containing protein n=1 Tax=Aspergillus pseudoustus TaxID=1810923 RepID=A0ABR4JRU3_9EURO